MTQLFDNLTANPIVDAVLLAIAGAAGGLWLLAAWWTYADMARRVRPELLRMAGPAWILVSTPVLLPLSLATYLLVRPQETAAERRSRQLLTALAPTLGGDLTCPTCAEVVDPAWRRCPSCSAWLGAPCSRCGRWSAMDLKVCPFCAAERTAGEEVVESEAETATAVDRRGLRWQPVGMRAEGSASKSPAPSRGAGNRGARDVRRAGRAASASGPRLARIGR